MRTLWQDLRYGIRILKGSPAFTIVAVLTLALGIAASTTVFSWIDSVLLRPLPGVGDGAQLVAFESIQPDREGHNISYRDFRDYRDNLHLLSGVAVSDQPNAFSVGEGEHAERVWGELVSGNYFDVLRVTPALGRFFSPEEQGDKPAAYPVAVISERLWQSRFHGDRGVLGKTIRVNRTRLTVVGVAPRDFFGITRGLAFEMWVPIMMAPQLGLMGVDELEGRKARGLQAIGRLAPGVSVERARAEAMALSHQLETENPKTNEGVSATVFLQPDGHTGAQDLLRAPLMLLLAMCFVVLLIACANVANLLLARSAARRKELGIRMALGAGRGRLARQLLTEALLLAALGAFVGAPLTAWGRQALSYLAPASIALPVHVGSETHDETLVFAILISLAAALLSGISPALHALRTNLNEHLKEGGRSATPGAHSQRLRGVFVAAQVALALVALVGAGLFMRSFWAARAIDPGFDARHVLVSQFHLSSAGYTDDQRTQFCVRLQDRLEGAPGIVGVSYADRIPLGFGLGPSSDLEIQGYVPRQGENMVVSRNRVGPGYFATLRIPVLEGREFTSHDDAAAQPVIVINQTFARRFLGSANPVGRKVRAWDTWLTVIGLVRDGKYYTLSEAPRPYFFVPFEQRPTDNPIDFYVRTRGNPDDALKALRREAAAIDPEVGAFEAMPLADYIAAPLFPQKVAASLLSVLGALSLLLAAVGLYSVMAYAVSQRRNEIGIRMALGARVNDVLAMVMRQGLLLTAAGLAAGLVVALAAARLIGDMLVNVSAFDPLIFIAAVAFLGAIALLASYLPARRATKVDPMTALRCE
ncbi:MAG TPA: ABC transporter permease [Bryobacteraceae bacterium]|nr:ABC transporter permease [Bryobacteraceae bacterium]